MKKILTYEELIRIPTFEERLQYLRLYGAVSDRTFGGYRYINQAFYRSKEWKDVRDQVIVRDLGRDLAMDGYELFDQIVVHHMNPISIEDLNDKTDFLLNPNYLITTSDDTHKFIHYGIKQKPRPTFVERKPNDTCPWKL